MLRLLKVGSSHGKEVKMDDIQPKDEKVITDVVEIKKDVFEEIKKDMLKYKDEKKALKAELDEIKAKLPAGEQKPIKDQLLELLADKEAAKTAEQLMQEQYTELGGIVAGLKEQLTKSELEKELIKKQTILKDKANEMKFANPDLLNKLVDLDGDIDAQLKSLVEANPFLIKQDEKPKHVNQHTNFNQNLPEDKSKWTPLQILQNL